VILESLIAPTTLSAGVMANNCESISRAGESIIARLTMKYNLLVFINRRLSSEKESFKMNSVAKVA